MALPQMTLGGMIAHLETLPPDTEVANLRNPHSYRGYYDHLAFERPKGTRPAGELLEECRQQVGSFHSGYHGGQFRMSISTPVWVACYGDLGQQLCRI
jgi:hypothetical protein